MPKNTAEIVSHETITFKIITVDGNAAVGKTSASQALARLSQYSFFSSGLGYRCLGYLCLGQDLGCHLGHRLDHRLGLEDLNQGQPIPSAAQKATIEFTTNNEILLAGKILNADLHSTEVSEISAILSQQAWVRDKVNQALHRAVSRVRSAKGKGVVVEGRDMGTTVFPTAAYKFFLSANSDQRVQRALIRQQASNTAQAKPLSPTKSQLDSVRTELEMRDTQDIERRLSPLLAAKDAIRLDTSEIGLAQVVDNMYQNLRL